MSCDVYVKVKIRALDVRRFVREFKKEYGDLIEDAQKLKTEGDVLDALLGWMDGARPARLNAKDGCWRFTGDDVVASRWADGGFRKLAFDWNKYVVYDEGLTPDDLAVSVRKYAIREL